MPCLTASVGVLIDTFGQDDDLAGVDLVGAEDRRRLRCGRRPSGLAKPRISPFLTWKLTSFDDAAAD